MLKRLVLVIAALAAVIGPAQAAVATDVQADKSASIQGCSRWQYGFVGNAYLRTVPAGTPIYYIDPAAAYDRGYVYRFNVDDRSDPSWCRGTLFLVRASDGAVVQMIGTGWVLTQNIWYVQCW